MDNTDELKNLAKGLKETMDRLTNKVENIIPTTAPKKIKIRVGLFKEDAHVFISATGIIQMQFINPKKGQQFYDSLK